MNIPITPIAHIHTPYKQKFAIPRQPGLVKHAKGCINFTAEFNDPNFLRGIEAFSHLWLIFHFHQTAEQGFSPLVRPPRLGGNQKQGVFATRSTFRPNSIGMSVVEFADITQHNKQLQLHVNGVDLLDGTPILDIKPYVPYADTIQHAHGGYAQQAPTHMDVTFCAQALKQLHSHQKDLAHLQSLITEVLAQDPRPAYHKKKQSEKTYGMTLYDFNIRWQVENGSNQVLSIEKQSL